MSKLKTYHEAQLTKLFRKYLKKIKRVKPEIIPAYFISSVINILCFFVS